MPPMPPIPPMPPGPPAPPGGSLDLLDAMTSSIRSIMHADSVAALRICSLTASRLDHALVPHVGDLPGERVDSCPLLALAVPRPEVDLRVDRVHPCVLREDRGYRLDGLGELERGELLPAGELLGPLPDLARRPRPRALPRRRRWPGISMTSFVTMIASCMDLSASSTTLCEPPRTRMVTAFGFFASLDEDPLVLLDLPLLCELGLPKVLRS